MTSKTRKIAFLIILSLASMALSQITQTGNKGLLHTHSAQTLGKGVLGVNAAGYFSFDKNFVTDVLIIDESLNQAYYGEGVDPTYVSTYYNLSYGLFSFWDISIGLPFYVDNTGIADGTDNGAGDLTFSMKIQYPPYEHYHVFDMTYFGQLYIPTASKNKGLFPRQPYYTKAQNIKPGSKYLTNSMINSLRFPGVPNDPDSLYDKITSLKSSDSIPVEDYYYGAGYASFLAKMLWTFDASEINPDVNIKWHLNFGALFTGKADKDNIFELGSALEYTPHPVITAFTDFYGQARFSQLAAGFDLGKEPLLLGFGICLNIPGGAHLSLAIDKCFSFNDKYKVVYYNDDKNQAYQTKIFPEWGLSISANWTGSVLGTDSDKDGIPDKIDRCPEEPEDVDGFEDADGCPDNDNDRDGILDIRDKCPMDAEDMDNFEDADGCPDIDNDSDNIPDKKDKCPMDAEDIDGFEDNDGCPDIDNDKDGVPDSLDKCPVNAEDVDGFEDKDGCPDLDNDQDGIPDDKDKCPDKKENFNGFQDEDGCPDVKAKEIKGNVVLKGVNFKTGSSELTYESGAVLEKVVESMKAYKDVCIEIRGYTDSHGSARVNRRLSQQRAESVRNFLIGKGINPSRIKASGFGEQFPVASNRTASGRAQNRRIEMYRIKCN